METKYQTSFIPKKPLTSEGQSRSVSLLLLVSIVIFLVSLGLAAYVFFDKKILIQNIKTDQASITKYESSFDSTTIESLIQLNSRIAVAGKLLNAHVAVSPIFNFLQKATLRNVRFKNFSFSSASPNTAGVSVVSVQMSGTAADWNTVASQADEFDNPLWNKIISQPKISNLNLNADGSVSFTFSANIAPKFLVYGNNANQ